MKFAGLDADQVLNASLTARALLFAVPESPITQIRRMAEGESVSSLYVD